MLDIHVSLPSKAPPSAISLPHVHFWSIDAKMQCEISPVLLSRTGHKAPLSTLISLLSCRLCTQLTYVCSVAYRSWVWSMSGSARSSSARSSSHLCCGLSRRLSSHASAFTQLCSSAACLLYLSVSPHPTDKVCKYTMARAASTPCL